MTLTKHKSRSNEQTMPSGKILKSISKSTAEFFSQFPVTLLSRKTGINESTIRAQKCRLKISQEAATAFCKLAEVKMAGFTREMLRPDIRDWIEDK